MRSARDGLRALAGEIRDRGGTAASAIAERPARDGRQPGPAQVAASGPRAAGLEREYELLMEMIDEGSRLHYGRPRVLRDDDRDLALLLGDQLYAMGLARLAELGDLDAVRELGDLISMLAQARAEDAHEDLVEAIWHGGARAVGWGSSPAHEAAKEAARVGADDAAAALRRAFEPSGS